MYITLKSLTSYGILSLNLQKHSDLKNPSLQIKLKVLPFSSSFTNSKFCLNIVCVEFCAECISAVQGNTKEKENTCIMFCFGIVLIQLCAMSMLLGKYHWLLVASPLSTEDCSRQGQRLSKYCPSNIFQ